LPLSSPLTKQAISLSAGSSSAMNIGVNTMFGLIACSYAQDQFYKSWLFSWFHFMSNVVFLQA